jgi:hypothetical protein
MNHDGTTTAQVCDDNTSNAVASWFIYDVVVRDPGRPSTTHDEMGSDRRRAGAPPA